MSGTGWVRTLCALSLLLVAFAHKPIALADTLPVHAEADAVHLLLPGFAQPELRLTDESEGDQHAGVSVCEACRIVASADLSTPVDVFLINRRVADFRPVCSRDAGPRLAALRPGASPRAPPAFSA